MDRTLHKQIEYQLNPDYDAIVEKYAAGRFKFNTDGNALIFPVALPRRHDEYLLDHDFYDLSLSPKNESLLYFDGKEEYFCKLIADLFPQNEKNEGPHENAAADVADESGPITLKIIKTSAGGSPANRRFKPGDRTGKCGPSDRDKKNAGQKAADLVLKVLKTSEEYEVGIIYSEYLAPKEGQSGDDSKGYDLEYRRKGEYLYRCLEIKNCPSGSEFILTANEYEVSQELENRDRYDIALVSGNQVMIWENALKDRNAYTLLSEGYKVKFKIKPTDI